VGYKSVSNKEINSEVYLDSVSNVKTLLDMLNRVHPRFYQEAPHSTIGAVLNTDRPYIVIFS